MKHRIMVEGRVDSAISGSIRGLCLSARQREALVRAMGLAVLAVVVVGCSSGTRVPSLDGVDVSKGDVKDQWSDDLPGELEGELDWGPQADLWEVDTKQCQPGDGHFGCPCSGPEDCLSGYCELHLGERICTQTCIEDCPEGFRCEESSDGGPDRLFLCLSPYPSLCLPCDQRADCSGAKARCLTYNEGLGSFCGQDCQDASQCPAGYECQEARTVTGAEVTACVAVDLTCECSQYAVLHGLDTECRNTNAHGTCVGRRECTAEGLTDCSAAVPAAEECDGSDNDCNGLTDDGTLCDDGNECTLNRCDGAAGCHTEFTSAPCTSDGDPCTLDLCMEGVCTHDPMADGDPCDDGDPCTLDETCQSGDCTWDSLDPACMLLCGDGECDPTIGEHCSSCPADCGCEAGQVCLNQACCTPSTCDTLGKQCGTWSDGCGGQTAPCGDCTAFPNSFCTADGQCGCQPACQGMECGNDGCGGTCGVCPPGESCSAGFQCEPVVCLSDLACTPWGLVCDPLSKSCVECLRDTDCLADDKVCLGKVCVQVDRCLSSLDCDGQVCDELAGYCVDCLATPDCPVHHICRHHSCQSVVPCVSSLQCTNQICDTTKGYCVECLTNADCGPSALCTAEQTCKTYTVCATDLTCTPLGKLCNQTLGLCVQCITDLHCPEVYHCTAQGVCELDVCVADSGACDGPVAVTCLSNGSGWATAAVCGTGKYCQSGVCHDWVCVPDAASCDGSVAKVCNGLGSGYASQTSCAPSGVCVGGACQPLVCTPFSPQCEGLFSYRQCNALGTAWGSTTPCPSAHYCQSGTCLLQQCTPGQWYCVNGEEVGLCDAKGSGPSSVVPCASGTTCVSGECLPVICQPQSKTCLQGKSATCNATGTGYILVACGAQQYCQAGVCYNHVCVPNELYCADNAVRLCNAEGSGFSLVTDCTALGQHCWNASCQEQVCTPLGKFCVGDSVATCAANGLSFTTQACGAQQYCQDGACHNRVCTLDAVTCQGTKVMLCNSQGSSQTETIDCATLGQACHEGACVDMICTPNHQTCDAKKVQQCSSDGLVLTTVQTCSDTQYCRASGTTASCLTMVCTPSTQFCLLNSVMQCNEEGSGMTTLQGCTEEEICKEGVCVENAICGGIQCPELPGYDISCNSRDFCEYTNPDATGWKAWDVWIYVPPGSFSMGSPASEEGRGTDEGPVHTVTFAYGFFIAKYETVVQQYEACRAASPTLCTAPSTADWTAGTWGTNTSEIGRMTHPQNGLTWQQAKNVCAWLAADGRLPSEAEWEYAAKGPSHKKFPWGDAPAPTCSNGTAVFNQAQMSTTGGCGSGGTWPVGSKALGLSWTGALDTSGNVWEWCEDKYNSNYVGAPVDGTPWVDTGVSRTIRGGGFNDSAVTMRSAQRYLPGLPPSHRSAHMGVRCVRPEPSRQ